MNGTMLPNIETVKAVRDLLETWHKNTHHSFAKGLGERALA